MNVDQIFLNLNKILMEEKTMSFDLFLTLVMLFFVLVVAIAIFVSRND